MYFSIRNVLFFFALTQLSRLVLSQILGLIEARSCVGGIWPGKTVPKATQTTTWHLQNGRDHNIIDLKTRNIARLVIEPVLVLPHVDPEPVLEPAAPIPVDPLDPESPNAATAFTDPNNVLTAFNGASNVETALTDPNDLETVRPSTATDNPSITNLGSLALSLTDALPLTGAVPTTVAPSISTTTIISSSSSTLGSPATGGSSTTEPQQVHGPIVATGSVSATRAPFLDSLALYPLLAVVADLFC